MEAEAARRCPICECGETRAEFPHASGPARRWPLVRCLSCELVYQSRTPEPSELEAAQRGAYGRPGRRFAGPLERLIRLGRSARVRLARRHMPPDGRALDVGCGRGLFLQMLARRGHPVLGTELSAETAANALPGVPVRTGELIPGQLEDGSLDLVSIWHVLEHLPDPDRALEAVHRALAPGGALLLAVPNYASFQARLGGERWFHLDLPRHLWHFTPGTLRALLAKRDFELASLRTGQWEMDPFGLLQTALNRMGLRHNGLYDTLRNNPGVRRDLSRPQRLALLALLVAGIAPAFALSLLMRLTGRAGTIVAVARKRAEGYSSLPISKR